MSTSDGEVVGHSYTRARLWPTVVGRMPGPGGGRLWGGPYTRQQLGVLVVSFLVLVLSQDVWARGGFVLNVAVVVGVPYGLAWVTRRVEASGRSPVATVGAAVGLLSAPRGGRLRGRAVREPRSARAVGLCTVGGGSKQPVAEAGSNLSEVLVPSLRPVATRTSASAPVGAARASSEGAVLSGAQALVARAARDRGEAGARG